MREIILRQSTRLNGTSFNLNRLQSSSSSSSSSSSGGDTSSSTELQPDRGFLSTGIQADLQQRASRLRSRQQQTGEAHQEEVRRQGTMPTLQSFLSGITSPIRRERPVEQVDSSSDDDRFKSISPRDRKRKSKNRKEKSSSSTARASTDALRDIPTITGRFRKS